MINLDLQYILLNSEPTVSFFLLKKQKTKQNKMAKAEPIGRFSTDQKINLSFIYCIYKYNF